MIAAFPVCNVNLRLRFIHRFLYVLIILSCCGHTYAQTTAVNGKRVELELVLAVDASTSIDAREFQLQREGFARAFKSREVQAAIVSLGNAGMVVSVVQWAGIGKQKKVLDWHFINGKASADNFAQQLLGMPRAVDGFTDIAGALAFSTQELLTNEWRGARLTIDVSGDGTSDNEDPAPYRDVALSKGITINGLAIFSYEHDLGDLAQIELQRHYENSVIGGPGSFLITAHRFENFEEAIGKKLIREITGPAFVERRFSAPGRKFAVRQMN